MEPAIKLCFLLLSTFISQEMSAQKVWIEPQIGHARQFYQNSGRNDMIAFEYGTPMFFAFGLHYRIDSTWSVIGRLGKAVSNGRYYTPSSISNHPSFFFAPDPVMISLEVAYLERHSSRVDSRFQAGISCNWTHMQANGVVSGINHDDTMKTTWVTSRFMGFERAFGLTGQYALSYRIGKYISASVFVNGQWFISQEPLQQIETTFHEWRTGHNEFQTHKQRKTRLNIGIGFLLPL